MLLQAAADDGKTALGGVGQYLATGEWNGSFKTMGTPIGLYGPWCLDAALGLGMGYGEQHAVGQLNPTADAFVASGDASATTIVAGLRPDGVIIDVDGTYLALLSNRDEDLELEVFIGYLVFVNGCLDEDSVFHNHGRVLSVQAGDCLSVAADTGLFNLILTYTNSEGGLANIGLRGAIGPDGEVLLMDRVGVNGAFGALVALRAERAVSEPFAGSTSWVVAMNERPERLGYRGAVGALYFEDRALINGVLGGRDVIGERFAIDEYGRFVLMLRTSFEHHAWSGYLSPQRDFGFFYEVDRNETWNTVNDVSEEPIWPSFGLIVRRTE
jgi:hypothetical protein